MSTKNLLISSSALFRVFLIHCKTWSWSWYCASLNFSWSFFSLSVCRLTSSLMDCRRFGIARVSQSFKNENVESSSWACSICSFKSWTCLAMPWARAWYPLVRIFNFSSILTARFASFFMWPRFCSSRLSKDSILSFFPARLALV